MHHRRIIAAGSAYEKWFNYHIPEHYTAFAVMGEASKTAELICMIFHPKSGRMDIAFGNGCEMPYMTYSF